MEDTNQAWYKAATKLFKPGTPEGDPHPRQRSDDNQQARRSQTGDTTNASSSGDAIRVG